MLLRSDSRKSLTKSKANQSILCCSSDAERQRTQLRPERGFPCLRYADWDVAPQSWELLPVELSSLQRRLPNCPNIAIPVANTTKNIIQRVHTHRGLNIQRDVYSAFLALSVKDNALDVPSVNVAEKQLLLGSWESNSQPVQDGIRTLRKQIFSCH